MKRARSRIMNLQGADSSAWKSAGMSWNGHRRNASLFGRTKQPGGRDKGAVVSATSRQSRCGDPFGSNPTPPTVYQEPQVCSSGLIAVNWPRAS